MPGGGRRRLGRPCHAAVCAGAVSALCRGRPFLEMTPMRNRRGSGLDRASGDPL